MYMNAETLERNGKTFAAVRDLLEHSIEATKMTVACRSGYNEKETEKALISMHKQGAIVLENGYVTRLYSFTQPLRREDRKPAPKRL